MTQLTNKIININNRRTSMRLCLKEWDALNQICKNEKISRNKLIEMIENYKDQDLGLTYSTRLFILEYYRALAKPSKTSRNKNEVSPAILTTIHNLAF